MDRGFFSVQFLIKCVVLMKNCAVQKVYYLVAQGCKKVNSSKNGRFRYEMIAETQSEVELLEAVSFIYPFSLKAGSLITSATRI